ncbi:hypothetical protein KSP39_PZI022294 [Platanthera zijinensis]|uniref:Uncharacterized protein n=1 Tax=Platanthera zijinensis TaxID=2320716 RepID=A0AAP0AUU0_9ASPA
MAFVLLSPSSTPLTLPLKILKPTSPLPLNRALKSGPVPRPLSLTAVSPASELAHTEDNPETSLPSSSYEELEVPFSQGLEESVLLLKRAAKSRKVPSADVLTAISDIKKAKVEESSFLEILGGLKSPGRTWMLIFTAQGGLNKGSYFPVTAVQRFDAEAKRIENGIYLGPIGRLTFEGKFSWKKRILAFLFEYLRIQVGPFSPLEISLGKQEREPNTKDPFFVWFYVDDDIAIAQGKGGGIALWCRCHRVA